MFLCVCSEAVILGEHDTRTNPDCDGDICADPIQIIRVAHIEKPSEYNTENFWHDVIVIRLEHPAQLNGKRFSSKIFLLFWISVQCDFLY